MKQLVIKTAATYLISATLTSAVIEAVSSSTKTDPTTHRHHIQQSRHSHSHSYNKLQRSSTNNKSKKREPRLLSRYNNNRGITAAAEEEEEEEVAEAHHSSKRNERLYSLYPSMDNVHQENNKVHHLEKRRRRKGMTTGDKQNPKRRPEGGSSSISSSASASTTANSSTNHRNSSNKLRREQQQYFDTYFPFFSSEEEEEEEERRRRLQSTVNPQCMITEQISASEAVTNILKDPDSNIIFRDITASSHACFKSFTNGYNMGTISDPMTGLPMTNPPGTSSNYFNGQYLMPDKGLILSSGNPDDFCINDSDQQTTQWRNMTWAASGDADLTSIAKKNSQWAVTYDACIIEFGKYRYIAI